MNLPEIIYEYFHVEVIICDKTMAPIIKFIRKSNTDNKVEVKISGTEIFEWQNNNNNILPKSIQQVINELTSEMRNEKLKNILNFK